MTLAFASDHRGYKLKEELVKYYDTKVETIDCGTYNDISCDYPDYAFKLGKIVATKNADFGVAICGTGIGISIACNKVKGIRCAKIDNEEEAKITRKDNDSNIVALNENLDAKTAIKIIDSFINTKASNEEKHVRRINKITKYEEEHER